MAAYLVELRVRVSLLLLTLVFRCYGKHDDLIVNTDKGQVRGLRYFLPWLTNTTQVDCYLGIPYAEVPTRANRFRHPRPKESWGSTVHNATNLPNSCYQQLDSFFKNFPGVSMWNSKTDLSEDCLYINVYVPHHKRRLRNSAVLVWIYGGGFYSGTSTLRVYDGKVLAALNDIIVVTFNYRVSVLGFLTLGTPSAPGNAGLFDQLMALDGVQKNIHVFGGDKDNVTLFGESAGSVSVSLHLVSPLSRGMFNRAIMQSGTANMHWGTYTMAEGRRRALDFAITEVNCTPTDDMEKILLCLQTTDVHKLVTKEWVTRGILEFPFIPVIDGAFLIEPPILSLQRKNFKKCPILLGSNSNEGSWFIIYELTDLVDLNTYRMSHKQQQDSLNALFTFYPQYPHKFNNFGLSALLHQYTNWESPEDSLGNLALVDQALADRHFVCQVNEFARYYASGGENVYSYYFTHRYESNPWPKWMGVLHGDEILFVFGEPFKSNTNYTEIEKKFSLKIMEYWTNFAKTGNPNVAPGKVSLEEWPPYTVQSPMYLELHPRILEQEAIKSLNVGYGPRLKQCAFWHHYIPKLLASTANIDDQSREWMMMFREWKDKYIVDWKHQFDYFVKNHQENC